MYSVASTCRSLDPHSLKFTLSEDEFMHSMSETLVGHYDLDMDILADDLLAFSPKTMRTDYTPSTPIGQWPLDGDSSTLARCATDSTLPPYPRAFVALAHPLFPACLTPSTPITIDYGVHSHQGPRATQEDTWCRASLPSTPSGAGTQLFAVLDGHGGDYAAHFTSHALEILIPRSMQYATSLPHAMIDAVHYTESILLTTAQAGCAGTTLCAVCARDATLCVATLGDSRALLINPNGEEAWASVDHRCSNPDEFARVIAAGGTVAQQRVSGELAVTRSLGSKSFKRSGSSPGLTRDSSPLDGFDSPPDVIVSEGPVSHIPDVTELHFSNAHAGVWHLVLATDGLWDFTTHSHVASCVREAPQTTPQEADERPHTPTEDGLMRAARQLASSAMCGSDNVSVMILRIHVSGDGISAALPTEATPV